MDLSFFIFDDFCLHIVNFPDKLRCQQTLRCPFSCDPAVFEGVNPVAEHGRNIQVVDGRDHRHIQILYNPHQLKLVGNVQMVGRFIQNQAGCLLSQGSCENNPLLFPSGKRGETSIRKFRHADSLQCFFTMV